MNEEEKRIILDILEDLKKSNELDNQDIGIITGYSGQKDILRNSVKAIGYDRKGKLNLSRKELLPKPEKKEDKKEEPEKTGGCSSAVGGGSAACFAVTIAAIGFVVLRKKNK